MFCPNCGKPNDEGAAICSGCGTQLSLLKPNEAVPAGNPNESAEAAFQVTSDAQGMHTTNVHVQVPFVQKNGLGTAGFVLAMIGLFTSWVPVLGWVVWFLGGVLSVVGIFRVPKGLAIAGTVITFIDLILLLFVITACSAIGGFVS